MSDLISRQDAIDEIQMLLEQFEDDEHDKTWNNAIRGAVNAVKHHTKSAQPTIDAVEVKHGGWEKGIHMVECSVCSEKFDFGDETWVEDFDICEDIGWRYCPNCGAKMDGEVKNDEMV